MLYLGEWIRTLRIRHGYTQEALAEGICTASTLSKIENGSSLGSKRIVDSILERMLGTQVERICYETKYSFRLRILKNNIIDLMERSEFDDALNLTYRLEQEVSDETPALKQFAVFARTACEKDKSYQEQIKTSYAALQITLPKEINLLYLHKKKVILSQTEILILNHIATCHYLMEQYSIAQRLLELLYEYLSMVEMKTTISAPLMPWIIHNRALFLEHFGLNEEAERLCQMGSEIAIAENRLMILPQLLYVQGRCRHEMKDEKKACALFSQADTILELAETASGHDSIKRFIDARMPALIAM